MYTPCLSILILIKEHVPISSKMYLIIFSREQVANTPSGAHITSEIAPFPPNLACRLECDQSKGDHESTVVRPGSGCGVCVDVSRKGLVQKWVWQRPLSLSAPIYNVHAYVQPHSQTFHFETVKTVLIFWSPRTTHSI